MRSQVSDQGDSIESNRLLVWRLGFIDAASFNQFWGLLIPTTFCKGAQKRKFSLV